ncbi:hypothetical protein O9G_004203 [Rozella allomycis CSF55]|uniref:Uncharacterized protein n=1 Tax=Rozella allomycis (strain CSF55) TaxID=988480 RepID=A0A075AY55_ROZAC|nr:hypothetical protein O9G_004203 [Rozella allomycis CSF55]|eukprot:EPZ35192.1 hypothetical protein O9G_004203 [Rozella allomycis CSF55]
MHTAAHSILIHLVTKTHLLFQDGQWKLLQSSPVILQDPILVATNKSIYAFGNFNPAMLLEYDRELNTWIFVSSIFAYTKGGSGVFDPFTNSIYFFNIVGRASSLLSWRTLRFDIEGRIFDFIGEERYIDKLRLGSSAVLIAQDRVLIYGGWLKLSFSGIHKLCKIKVVKLGPQQHFQNFKMQEEKVLVLPKKILNYTYTAGEKVLPNKKFAKAKICVVISTVKFVLQNRSAHGVMGNVFMIQGNSSSILSIVAVQFTNPQLVHQTVKRLELV